MNYRHLFLKLSALLLGLTGLELHGQELSVLYGGAQTTSFKQSSYSYQVDYRQDFTQNFATSLGVLNEGHISTHKRDGYAWEAWLTLPMMDEHLAFSVGAGPYYYFDTQRRGATGSVDIHGTAPIYSFTATYYTGTRWFARFVYNQVAPTQDIHVNTASIGLGYWLGRGDRPKKGNYGDPAGAEFVTQNEFTVFGGKSVENTFSDSRTYAAALEYRHGLLPHVDGTLSYIYEGAPRLIRRNGAALQVWPVNAFDNGHFTVGMGFGLYASIDQKNIRQVKGYHAPAISPLVSPTFSVRLDDHWVIRGVFNRVVSYNGPDSDVFLLGLGFRWR
jgi:hypothetical protein